MVLIRILALLALDLALVSCKQSLFDGHPTGTTTTDAAIAIPSACPNTCTGDLAGDFNQGTRPWRYVEDNRRHAWTDMTFSGDIASGANAANTIASCRGSDAAACAKLPGSVLVSSAGATADADPAVEFKVTSNQVVRIDLAMYLDSGVSQTIRLYRNSREDVLYTGTVDAGSIAASSITIDALAGDRILVAVAPTMAGAKDLGLQLFLSDPGSAFGGECQLALEFAPITGTIVKNNCGADFTSRVYDEINGDADLPLVEIVAPYAELGSAGMLKDHDYYSSAAVIDHHGDSTTQLWLQWQGIAEDNYGWYVSDADYTTGGGLGIDIGSEDGGVTLLLGAYIGMSAGGVGVNGSFPVDHAWHFVRASYTAGTGTLSLCLDGKLVKSMAGLPPLVTAQPTYLGYNHDSSPVGAFVNGAVDDVRVLHTALPCE